LIYIKICTHNVLVLNDGIVEKNLNNHYVIFQQIKG